MEFAPKNIILKDGRTAILRSAAVEDAAELLDYLKTTAEETEFILRYPEECNMTMEQEETILRNKAESPDELMLVCDVDGRLAGNCGISFNNKIKLMHRASVAIALRKEYWNLGIGTAMFRELIGIASRRPGVMQMELGFVEGNSRARALYEKMGFRIIGVMPDALHMKDGRLLNEYMMMKKL